MAPRTRSTPRAGNRVSDQIALTRGDTPKARAEAETRLEPELRALAALGLELRDWRKLPPGEVAARFQNAREGIENRSLLASAVFVGTAQACIKGSYWAPEAGCPGAMEVQCEHLRRPVSRLYPPDRNPPPENLTVRSWPTAEVKITCFQQNQLDVCGQVWAGQENRRLAMVRFSGYKDIRNTFKNYTHCREDQIFLRSTYYQAFEKMEVDISAPLHDAINAGGIIYTPDVGILRGPLEHGAIWYADPPRADVVWVGLLPRPQHAEQGQYADDKDKDNMGRVIDRLFAWAAAHDVDTLVLPAIGCGTHGCQHPHLDVADIIHKTAKRYARYIPNVCVCSDHPPHGETNWWAEFSNACEYGRPAIHRPVKVPVPPYPRPPKAASELAEKARRVTANKPRTPRHTFL